MSGSIDFTLLTYIIKTQKTRNVSNDNILITLSGYERDENNSDYSCKEFINAGIKRRFCNIVQYV
jgi:hypothetical protein